MKLFSLFILGFVGLAKSAPQGDDSGRIVNGIKATGIPYLCAVLKADNDILCGASIIDKRYILSAAHCFPPNPSASQFKVSVGTLEWKTGQVVGVEKIMCHEEYESFGSDICLLKLSKDLVYSDTLKPIALPKENAILPYGLSALVSGYGYTKTDGNSMVDHALQTRVPVLHESENSCSKPYRLNGKNFCAGNNGAATSDSCQGDSGGPLECQNQLIGIVSYGGKCNDPNAAGVYTKVSSYIGWINAKRDANGY